MDLFRLVADRLEDRPPQVRPRLLTPFEEQTPDIGFQEEDSEHEAVPVPIAIPGIAAPDPARSESAHEPESKGPPRLTASSEEEPTVHVNPVPATVNERVIDRTVKVEKGIEEAPKRSEPGPNSVAPLPIVPVEHIISQTELVTLIAPPVEPRIQTPLANPAVHTSPSSDRPSENERTTRLPERTEIVTRTSHETRKEVETQLEREVLKVPVANAPIEVVVEQNLLNQTITQNLQSGGKPAPPQTPTQAQSDTTIEIQIGRIEVNAARPAAPPAPRPPRPNPSRLSLDEVLKRRGS